MNVYDTGWLNMSLSGAELQLNKHWWDNSCWE